MEEKRIVEIDGVKIEVDLRTAKRIDTFAVGDNVKVLCKEYNNWLGTLLSLGDAVEVLSPEHVRTRLSTAAEKIVALYKKT